MTHEAVCQKLGEATRSLNAGQLRVAEKLLAGILGAYPNQADALHMLSHVSLQRGEVTQAVGVLERAVTARPADPDIRTTLANALGSLSRLQDAISVCRVGLKHVPENLSLLVILGRALGVLGDDDAAIEALEKARSLNGTDLAILSMLGALYFRQGDLTRTAQIYETALEIAPDDIETRFNLVSVHIRNFDYDAAIIDLQRIVKIDGDHLPSLRTLGNILGRTDRYGEAIQPLKRAMSLDPKDNLSANELIYALAIAGDPREAVHLGETYLRDNPRATFMHRQLAFAHLRAAQPKFAITCCDHALQTDHPPTTALSLKAAALNELDDRAAAAEILGLANFVQTTTPPAPDGYETLRHFNEDLQAQILNHPSLDYMPSNRSMKKGRGTIELFDGAEKGTLAVFKQVILDTVDAYIRALPNDSAHPFLRHRPPHLDVNGWGNVYDDDGKQTVHFHPPAWLSGVYYPIVPERIKMSAPDDFAGALELGRAYFRLESKDNPPVRVIKPEDGLMVLFPSYVGHQTIPLGKSSTPRVSIAFDLVPAA